jgi:hypothetical protein
MYHVTSRGRGKGNICLDDVDRLDLLTTLGEARRKKWKVIVYFTQSRNSSSAALRLALTGANFAQDPRIPDRLGFLLRRRFWLRGMLPAVFHSEQAEAA